MLLRPVIEVKARRPEYEVADVLRRYIDDYRREYRLSRQQIKVINAILRCRTAALGGYIRQCDVCGKFDVLYCSCKNRHCPKCGYFEKAQWLERQKALLLPIPYFQVVFTIDHVFNRLVWGNEKEMYGLLFDTASDLLKKYGQRYLGGELGFTMVLHTWGQTMQAHPHLHCIVTGGALVGAGRGARWQEAEKNYLFPVVKLSRDFRKAFCAGVRKLYRKGKLEWDEEARGQTIEELIARAESQNWEVFIEPPQKDPRKLLDYLGSYIYRIAISNYRIVAIEKGQVSFCYRDNRDGGQEKVMTLSAVEFIRRFLLHVLPHCFVRIRHYGLHHSGSRWKLRQARALLGLEGKLPVIAQLKLVEWLATFMEEEADRCPYCGEGRMRRVREFGPVEGWRSVVLRLLGVSPREKAAH
jgi:hypothetical protein